MARRSPLPAKAPPPRRNGTITFSVNAGETFGFGVFTTDGLYGAGTATFTNFVPAPGAIALLGAAGLIGGRRRRA
jgi:hypothetical protein